MGQTKNPGRPSTWSPEQIAALRAMAEQGVTAEQAAKIVDRDKQHLLRMSSRINPPIRWTYPKDRRARALSLAKQAYVNAMAARRANLCQASDAARRRQLAKGINAAWEVLLLATIETARRHMAAEADARRSRSFEAQLERVRNGARLVPNVRIPLTPPPTRSLVGNGHIQ